MYKMGLLLRRQNNSRPSFSIVLVAILLILESLADAKTSVYIVYMGRRQHDDLELLTQTHHQALSNVLGSKEASAAAMVYSYKHGFSGFAAKLTEDQAQMASDLPGVVQVIPNHLYKLQTTRSWDYLGLPAHSPTNLMHKTRMGEDVIIGLLDTGIWPESSVFRDEDVGPIPSRWKGVCESGESFNPSKDCNRKLIGARFFIKALIAEYGQPYNTTETYDSLSSRDSSGHGTHTSTIAAGYFVDHASLNGFAAGTVRGGAPRARLAMYKVCWNLYGGVCASADVLKAFDEAIHDGVDVLSVSISSDIPSASDVDNRDGIPIGSFHAVMRGIVVVCAAGNLGPKAQTVTNTAPWILTVAASSVDRSYPTPIILGNNFTIMGQAMFTGKDTDFASLMYPEVSDLLVPRYCESFMPNETWMGGNVVLCFTMNSDESAIYNAAKFVRNAGGLGLIVAGNPSKAVYPSGAQDFPCVQVSYEVGNQMLYYIRSTRRPQVRVRTSKTHVGKPVSSSVADFSSRGPNPVAPAVLKPDIAAPGEMILAAVPPVNPGSSKGRKALAFLSGTSMATPHVSGIVALLKALHKDWSPAAIKSAIVTTAWTSEPSGEPILAKGEPTKVADPFDFGGGIVNPNGAADPGLVYDMGTPDYIQYLCAMGYSNSAISHLTEHTTFCPPNQPSILGINLPSITIPSITGSVTLTRTVTNVGAIKSKYKAIIQNPPGITISVHPDTLIFNSTRKTNTFRVVVSSGHQVSSGYSFGSLTWTDGVHAVTSPISVRSHIPEPYD